MSVFVLFTDLKIGGTRRSCPHQSIDLSCLAPIRVRHVARFEERGPCPVFKTCLDDERTQMNRQHTLGHTFKAMLEEMVKSLKEGERQKAREVYTQRSGEFNKRPHNLRDALRPSVCRRRPETVQVWPAHAQAVLLHFTQANTRWANVKT